MGQGWRATDTQLNRDVAPKILPSMFLRSFQRCTGPQPLTYRLPMARCAGGAEPCRRHRRLCVRRPALRAAEGDARVQPQYPSGLEPAARTPLSAGARLHLGNRRLPRATRSRGQTRRPRGARARWRVGPTTARSSRPSGRRGRWQRPSASSWWSCARRRCSALAITASGPRRACCARCAGDCRSSSAEACTSRTSATRRGRLPVLDHVDLSLRGCGVRRRTAGLDHQEPPVWREIVATVLGSRTVVDPLEQHLRPLRDYVLVIRCRKSRSPSSMGLMSRVWPSSRVRSAIWSPVRGSNTSTRMDHWAVTR